jgi:hypothetical protein
VLGRGKTGEQVQLASLRAACRVLAHRLTA